MKRDLSAKQLLTRVKTQNKRRAKKRLVNQVKRLEKRLDKVQAA
jgi:hypothetical protein